MCVWVCVCVTVCLCTHLACWPPKAIAWGCMCGQTGDAALLSYGRKKCCYLLNAVGLHGASQTTPPSTPLHDVLRLQLLESVYERCVCISTICYAPNPRTQTRATGTTQATHQHRERRHKRTAGKEVRGTVIVIPVLSCSVLQAARPWWHYRCRRRAYRPGCSPRPCLCLVITHQNG